MNTFIEEPARQTPIVARADVVVVGGGIAGLAAAVASAKNGAKTLLVEAQNVLGGTVLGGSSVLNSFTNNPKLHPEGRRIQLVRGFGQEIIDRMSAAGGCPGFAPGMTLEDEGAPRQVIMLPEVWKRVSFGMIEDYGIELMTRTLFENAAVENGKIGVIVVHGKWGRGAIEAQVFVDTSGDGDLAASAGGDFIHERDQDMVKQTTLVFGLNNVDVPRVLEWGQESGLIRPREPVGFNEVGLPVHSFSINLQELPATAQEAEAMEVRHLHMIAVGSEMYYCNATRVRPPREEGLMSWRGAFKTEMENRHQIEVIIEMVRQHVAGFEKAYLYHTASHFGVRRTRTIKCEYDIPLTDIVEEKGQPDEIGRFGYQDLPWEGYSPRQGGSYGVPYRALIPLNVENLLVAGRMITSDWTAHMSTRNTGGCLLQGEGAGTAAALCAKRGVTLRELDVAVLQDALQKQGVYLERAA